MSTKVQTLEEWTLAFVKASVLEIVKVIAEEERNLGPKYAGHLFSSFLASYIGALVYKPLSEGHTSNSIYFTRVKSLIQEAVSAGFTGAVEQGTGNRTDYYCQVKVVPQPQTDKVS